MIHRWSGLARAIDPTFPTNRAVLLVAGSAAALGLGWRAWTGSAWLDAAAAGVGLALLVVVAWALTRELAPDQPMTAFVAVALALPAWVGLGDQSILVPAALLASARVVNRSTGMAARATDSVAVTGLFAWMIGSGTWSAGVVGGGALVLDSRLPHPEGQGRRPGHLWLGVVTVAVAGGAALGIVPTPWDGTALSLAAPVAAGIPLSVVVLAVLTLSGLYAAWRQSVAGAVGDADGRPLVPVRVRAGAALGVLGVALATVDGGVNPSSLGAGWGAVAALVVGTVVDAGSRRRG